MSNKQYLIEVIKMVEKTLLLDKIESVKMFVQYAIMQEYKITLSSGNYTVDAKSIMSIFSLDLTKPVILSANCEESDDFIKAVEQFAYKA